MRRRGVVPDLRSDAHEPAASRRSSSAAARPAWRSATTSPRRDRLVRDPGGRTSGSATTGASASTRCASTAPPATTGCPGWAVPLDPWTFPTKDEMADYLEAYAERFELPVITGVAVDSLSQGRRPLRRALGRAPLRGRQRRRGVGHLPGADRARVRRRARPGDHADALQRVPQPVAAAGRPRARRRLPATPAPTSRSRSRRSHATMLAGRSHGEVPFDIEGRVGAGWSLPVLWFVGQPRADDAHAARPQDAPGDPGARRPAAARQARRTWPPPAWSAPTRASRACATAGRCSTTAACSTSPT